MPNPGGAADQFRRIQARLVCLPTLAIGRVVSVAGNQINELGQPLVPQRLARHATEIDEQFSLSGQTVTLAGVLSIVAVGIGRFARCLRHVEVLTVW